MAGCASALRFDDRKIRCAFDSAMQQMSGARLYVRDLEKVQKAFEFGGLPARNGATAAMMARSGFTGEVGLVCSLKSTRTKELDLGIIDRDPLKAACALFDEKWLLSCKL